MSTKAWSIQCLRDAGDVAVLVVVVGVVQDPGGPEHVQAALGQLAGVLGQGVNDADASGSTQSSRSREKVNLTPFLAWAPPISTSMEGTPKSNEPAERDSAVQAARPI